MRGGSQAVSHRTGRRLISAWQEDDFRLVAPRHIFSVLDPLADGTSPPQSHSI